jgi:hypothetical protein
MRIRIITPSHKRIDDTGHSLAAFKMPEVNTGIRYSMFFGKTPSRHQSEADGWIKNKRESIGENY